MLFDCRAREKTISFTTKITKEHEVFVIDYLLLCFFVALCALRGGIFLKISMGSEAAPSYISFSLII
jgi:hypothetical protein